MDFLVKASNKISKEAEIISKKEIIKVLKVFEKVKPHLKLLLN